MVSPIGRVNGKQRCESAGPERSNRRASVLRTARWSQNGHTTTVCDSHSGDASIAPETQAMGGRNTSFVRATEGRASMPLACRSGKAILACAACHGRAIASWNSSSAVVTQFAGLLRTILSVHPCLVIGDIPDEQSLRNPASETLRQASTRGALRAASSLSRQPLPQGGRFCEPSRK